MTLLSREAAWPVVSTPELSVARETRVKGTLHGQGYSVGLGGQRSVPSRPIRAPGYGTGVLESIQVCRMSAKAPYGCSRCASSSTW